MREREERHNTLPESPHHKTARSSLLKKRREKERKTQIKKKVEAQHSARAPPSQESARSSLLCKNKRKKRKKQTKEQRDEKSKPVPKSQHSARGRLC